MVEKYKYTKYIHIMSHESNVFNKQIIEMINNNSEFDKDNHLFIISNEDVYNQVKEYNNTTFEKNIDKNYKIFKKYARNCNYIFLHSNGLKSKIWILMSKHTAKKIIWCEWGHDLYIKKNKPNNIYRWIRRIIKNVINFIPIQIKKNKMECIKAIGIGFQYDVIEARRLYGKEMQIYMTPYGYIKNNKNMIDKAIENAKHNSTIKVMIGHSAYPFLNHIKLLNKLAKFKDENICISLVLAYGDKEYAKKIIDYAINIFGKEKTEIIDKMMNYEEYIKYLSSVDVCLLDFTHQAALSNIYILLYMKKKLFVNRTGIIKLFTTLENIETYDIESIDTMNFDEFSRNVQNTENGKQFAEFHINEENYKKLWYNTIKSLEND